MKHFFILGFVSICLGLLASKPSIASDEPNCDGCLDYDTPALPRSGFWFDADRPGSGLNLDIQTSVLAGTAYTYDADGSQQWLLFSGPLEQAIIDGKTKWSVSATLREFSGGSCLTCEYRPNDGGADVGQIELTFDSRNSLTYSVDGGQAYRMRPLLFGAFLESYFDDFPDILLPTFGIGSPSFGGALEEINGSAWVILFGDPDGSFVVTDPARTPILEANPEILYASTFAPIEPRPYYSLLFTLATTSEFPDAMNVYCGNKQQLEWLDTELVDNVTSPDPFCIVRNLILGFNRPTYYIMPLSEMGDDYFKATAANGETIEGMRVGSRK
jgi:hypothetical protein